VGLKLGSAQQLRPAALLRNGRCGRCQAPPVFLEIKQELPSPWLIGPAIYPSLMRLRSLRPARTGCDNNPLNGSTKIDGISYLVRERAAKGRPGRRQSQND